MKYQRQRFMLRSSVVLFVLLLNGCGSGSSNSVAPSVVKISDDVSFTLVDGEQSHAESPETFQIPSLEIRKTLQPGQMVKLMFDINAGSEQQVERMWVLIKEVEGNFYKGELRNNSFTTDAMKLGLGVTFESKHVITIRLPRDSTAKNRPDFQKMADQASVAEFKNANDKRESQTTLEFEGVLYKAEFNPISTGCSVIATDLKSKKQLWKTQLQGLGPIKHSEYTNQVVLRQADSETLAILGNESSGRYLEYVDMKTGQTVGHKIFARDENEK